MAKKQNLNDAFAELEKIVEQFEDGQIDLEESLEKFKQGLKLAKQIKQQVKQMENQIVEIKKSYLDDEED